MNEPLAELSIDSNVAVNRKEADEKGETIGVTGTAEFDDDAMGKEQQINNYNNSRNDNLVMASYSSRLVLNRI